MAGPVVRRTGNKRGIELPAKTDFEIRTFGAAMNPLSVFASALIALVPD
jgi:hypothetical protein